MRKTLGIIPIFKVQFRLFEDFFYGDSALYIYIYIYIGTYIASKFKSDIKACPTLYKFY